ncbi:hypothetical protein [Streptomyces californicus]|uniref:hypothetical protein n=1 Tax=Streptomyces californicus TaxID=67351 RepID=UPI00379BD22C
MKNLRRPHVLSGSLAVLGAVAALLLPGPAASAAESTAPVSAPRAAAAAASGDYLGTGVRIRSQANGSSTVKGLGYAGQGATVYCWQDGRASDPNQIVSWFYHRNNATGVTGWSSWEVFRAHGDVPHC